MTGERVEQRLAAVFAVGVAGCSHLMGADETGKVIRGEQRHAVAAPVAATCSNGLDPARSLGSRARS